MPHARLICSVAAGCSLALLSQAVGPAAAQRTPLSQHGSVSQQVGNTRIIIEYNRPVARGRELFGKLVPWKRIWNPGADTATRIEVSTPLRVNGEPLPAGAYSVWAEPGPQQWTMIFNRRADVWHTRYPAGQDALRVSVTPRKGDHMETLAFYFPLVEGTRAELVLHWGTVVVPLQLEVPGR
jgi:hypothetical protein